MIFLDNRTPAHETDLGRAITVEIAGSRVQIETANGYTLLIEQSVITIAAAVIREAASCDCWVAQETAEEAFGIRYGAHFPQCPKYSPSLDPVKMVADAELRCMKEVGL